MARRYIDTGLFDDPWYMDLSKDAKILFTYYITKCTHAGLLELNEKLCKVQTGVTDIRGALEGLQSRLIEVREGLFFMPKFLFFQYPKFPQSKVFQQRAALEELTKLGLFKEGKLIQKEGLSSPFVDVYVNVDVKEESEEEILPNYRKAFLSVENDPEVHIPEGYRDMILTWLCYKSERGQTYKKTGIKSLINGLVTDTDGDPAKAKRWIDHSMANNYQGIYPPKNGSPVKPTNQVLDSSFD